MNNKLTSPVIFFSICFLISSYNLMNQLKTYGNETIKYDANGNRMEDGTYFYVWNAADQLTAI